jgi:pimeloyl-ACP methyl ester carboxylesterase
VDDYAGAMLPLFDALNLDDAVVVGHHTGASIAAAVAAAAGARTRAVVMHAPPLYHEDEQKALLNMPHFDQTPRADCSHITDRWKFAREALDNRATLEATQLSMLLFFMTGKNEWHGHHAVFGYDLAKALAAIDSPGLIMSNTGDISHEKTQRAREVRPDFEYAELEGGTVYITWEEPERWVQPIIDFASRL